MNIKLTRRQEEIISLIREHIDETGHPPTRSEISAKFGFRSNNAAEDHLKALAKKGEIEIIPGINRGIRLTGSRSACLPVIERVAAGSPVLAAENIESNSDIRADLFTPSADYLFRVKGLSMKDVGIMDGDLLAVHKTKDVHNGQIIVARLNDELTVKRFERKRNTVRLLSENPEFPPIVVKSNEQEVSIEGIYVGVIRH